jgi:hypothetical protein
MSSFDVSVPTSFSPVPPKRNVNLKIAIPSDDCEEKHVDTPHQVAGSSIVCSEEEDLEEGFSSRVNRGNPSASIDMGGLVAEVGSKVLEEIKNGEAADKETLKHLEMQNMGQWRNIAPSECSSPRHSLRATPVAKLERNYIFEEEVRLEEEKEDGGGDFSVSSYHDH